MKLIRASEWVATHFAEGSHPSLHTVTRWVRGGKLRGVVIGKLTYVDSGQPSLDLSYDTVPKKTITPR